MSLYSNDTLSDSQKLFNTCNELIVHREKAEVVNYSLFFAIYTPITVVAIISIGYLFWLHPKFSMHPYGLIGICCLMEGQALIYFTYARSMICDFDLATIWVLQINPLL